MPKISKRGTLMPDSPIRKLVPYSEKAIKKGIKVYKLNIGQPDIHTSPKAIEAIKNMDTKVIEYSHSAGLYELRTKLADYYKKYNISVDVDHIIITTGASEAINITLQSCLNAGDEIIVPEPFYANYFSFAITSDVKVIPVTSVIDNGFALPPMEEFKKKISSKTKAIIICNPNNPTGYLYSREELEQIKQLVKKYDLFLLSDEVYREFVYDGHAFHSAMHLKGIEDNTILIDSLSKRYSATGLRTGALVSKNKEIIHTAMKYCQARLSAPYVGQIAGVAALDTENLYLENVYNEYLSRRNFTVKALNDIPGVSCPLPKGAFYVIASLPVDNAEEFAIWMLNEFNYNNTTVMLTPAAGFYTTPGLGKQEVRIAYVLNKEDLREAMKCLRKGLEQYPGKLDTFNTNKMAVNF
jgi:aspartate aminotransferase